MEKDFEIVNTLGLHARAAAMLVQAAQKFKADVFVSKEGLEVNAKSIMGILMLAAAKGTVLSISTTGEDEEAAMESIGELIRNGFWEKD